MADAENADSVLREWRKRRLPELRNRVFQKSKYDDRVTVVAYSFPADVGGPAFDFVECAILQTWAVLGKMKTVIVAHRHFEKADAFAARHGDVDVQIEPTLVPGSIDTMSADCCARLATRFATPYCLIVQDDGFPLRDGLGAFLGKYDFIGAPYVRIAKWRNVLSRILGVMTLNGGFSLRSKRICEAAAGYWRRKYSAMHPSPLTVEDVYYTQTLPTRHLRYRMKYRIAPNEEAVKFSYDAIVRQPLSTAPMGFHRASTFAALQSKGFL